MKHHAINLLAIIGAAAIAVTAGGWATHRSLAVVMVHGRATTYDHRPVVGAAVFLDRGANTIERYTTDSLGQFHLPLFPREPHRATWLICAPGLQEFVGKPELDHVTNLPFYTYELSPRQVSTHGWYRASGWKGPIPRECPQITDTMVWRYPASAGKGYGASTLDEPDWKRYLGPPDLPSAK